jgi:hypothetical protein
MGIKDVFNQAPSIEEEALYKQVLDEVESGVMRKGIYAKALADGLGDEGKAQSLYIKYRVQSLMDEEKSKAELLGLPSKRQQKRIDKKTKSDEEWKNTHWFIKILSYLTLLFLIWFGFKIFFEYFA